LYVYWGIPKEVKLKIIILTKQTYGKDLKCADSGKIYILGWLTTALEYF
jgi:hypothetical protein